MAKTLNLIIDQGTDWSTNVVAYTANGTSVLDLYPYLRGQSQMRKSVSSLSATATLDVNIHKANGSGIIELSMDSATTGSIQHGRYLYDVELLDKSTTPKITRICQGVITISPEITKV